MFPIIGRFPATIVLLIVCGSSFSGWQAPTWLKDPSSPAWILTRMAIFHRTIGAVGLSPNHTPPQLRAWVPLSAFRLMLQAPSICHPSKAHNPQVRLNMLNLLPWQGAICCPGKAQSAVSTRLNMLSWQGSICCFGKAQSAVSARLNMLSWQGSICCLGKAQYAVWARLNLLSRQGSIYCPGKAQSAVSARLNMLSWQGSICCLGKV